MHLQSTDSFCKIYNSVDRAPTNHTVTYDQVTNCDSYDLPHNFKRKVTKTKIT